MGLHVEILPPVEDMSPLDFLKGVYRNEKLPLHARLRAAADAAPFCHAKLAVHAQITGNDLAERLMRALEATQKVSNARLVQVIEHEPKADAGYLPKSRPFYGHSTDLSQRPRQAQILREEPSAWASRGSTEGTRMEGVRRLFLRRFEVPERG